MIQDTTTDYARRVQKVREVVAERDLDGLLILGPANRRYVSGYTAADGAIGESAGMVLVTSDRAALIVNPLYTDLATAEAAHSDADIEVVELRGRSKKLLPEKLIQWGVRRLGFERDFTLYSFYEDLKKNIEDGGELAPVKGIVEEMRIRKSETELETMRRAGKIADDAYGRVTAALRPGMTERQVARALEEAMEELGAEGASFPTIVAAGANAARPHHEPGNTPINTGDPVVIDMGARYEGYCSDMTRSFCLGRADERYREIYGLVLRAHDASKEFVRAGVSCKDTDAVARDLLKEAGYEQEFSHSLGHGVGMDVHEAPSLHKESEDTLEAGMVVSIEPGLYLSGWGGVRIEDTVVVTADGFESLNHAAKGPVL